MEDRIDSTWTNKGGYRPGKFGPAYCSYCSRVTLISKPIHFIIYGGRHLISMREFQISMWEIQNGVKFAEAWLLESLSVTFQCDVRCGSQKGTGLTKSQKTPR